MLASVLKLSDFSTAPCTPFFDSTRPQTAGELYTRVG